jgi:hypothetical protein
MSTDAAASVDVELEAVLAAARAREALVPRQAIAKVSYSHEAMIDLIIANPGISQNAIAAKFGLTPSWVSQVIVSDTFQSALAKRRAEVVDPLLIATVKENFEALVNRSLDVLQQKLNRPAIEIPDNLALRALEIGSRAAGYGAKDPGAAATPATPLEVNIHLEQLGGGLVQLLQRKKLEAQVIEGTATSQIAQLTNDVSEEH